MLIGLSLFVYVCCLSELVGPCGSVGAFTWDDSPEAGHIQFVSPAFAAETQLIAYICSNWMEPVFHCFSTFFFA